MAGDNLVEVKFGADVSGLRSGAKEAGGQIDQLVGALKELTAALGQHGSGAQQSKKHTDSLAGAFRDFKSEAVSTGRQARFFARELAELIPGADGAKSALQDLIAVGLSGTIFGAAVEGVKFLAGAFHDLHAEEKAAREELDKFAKESLADVVRLRDELATAAVVRHGANEDDIKARNELAPLIAKELDLQERVTAGIEAQRLEKEHRGQIDASLYPGVEEAYLKNLEAELKIAKDRLETKRNELEVDRQDADLQAENVLPKGVVTADTERRRSDEAKLQRKIIDDRVAFVTLGAGEEQKIRVETAARIAKAEIDLKESGNKAIFNEEIEAARDMAAKRLGIIAQTVREEEAVVDPKRWLADVEEFAKWEAARLKVIFDQLRTVREEESIVDPEIAAKDLKQLQAHQDKVVKSWKHVGEEIGREMARTVSGIITGTQSIGDAFANLAQRLLDMALDKIFQGIFGALFGGGPLGGLLGGLLPFEEGGSIITAAAGADVPRVGGPFPALLHKGETVITHATTDRLDAFLDRAESGGGSAGGGYGGPPIHIHALDGESVMRVVRSYEFRRAVAESRRLGES